MTAPKRSSRDHDVTEDRISEFRREAYRRAMDLARIQTWLVTMVGVGMDTAEDIPLGRLRSIAEAAASGELKRDEAQDHLRLAAKR
jgi:hypothetical protein